MILNLSFFYAKLLFLQTYIHRSGRTARAQTEGLSLMLIEPQEGVFYKRIYKTLNKGEKN